MSFIADRVQVESLMFNNILLVPSYSDVSPHNLNFTTRFFLCYKRSIFINNIHNICGFNPFTISFSRSKLICS